MKNKKKSGKEIREFILSTQKKVKELQEKIDEANVNEKWEIAELITYQQNLLEHKFMITLLWNWVV